jgi:Uma2 family endonuclease
MPWRRRIELLHGFEAKMSIAPSPAVTPDDLLHMPDEGRGFELVHGDLRELNMSKESSRVASRVSHTLETYVDAGHPGWVFGEGTSYKCFPDDPTGTRRADASFISLERMPVETYEDEGHTTMAPDLVAEVISPHDLAEEVEEKRDEWLAAGVKIVWIVSPSTKTVKTYRRDGGYAFLHTTDILTAEGVLPGFSVSVAELFRKPGEPLAPR